MDCSRLSYPLTRRCPAQNARSQERIQTQVHRAAGEGKPKRDHAGDTEEKLQPTLWISETKLVMWPKGQTCSDSLSCLSAFPSLHNLWVGESDRANCHCDTDLLPLRVTDTEESRTYRLNSCCSLVYHMEPPYSCYTNIIVFPWISLQVYKQGRAWEPERISYPI